MVKLSLFLLKLLRLPLVWMGADFEQLWIILRTKLTIDFRRSPNSYQSTGKSGQTFGKQLIIFMVMGIFMAFSFIRIQDLMLLYTIVFSVIMVMTVTSLINEFTSVLFDSNDNLILLVRPVTNRTLLLSRILHIQFYIMYIALSLSVISFVTTLILFGFSTAFLFLIGVMLSTWISLLITSFFYLWLIRFFDAEKFKDIITYIQIFLIVIIIGGYQLLPRIADMDSLSDYSFTIHVWSYLLPPVWLAALVNLSRPENINVSVIILSAMAFLFSFIGGFTTIRFLSAGFGRVLTNSSEKITRDRSFDIQPKAKGNRLVQFFSKTSFEAAGWKMVMAVTRRDRKFKQAVYPSFGLMLILGFAMLRPDLNNFADWFQNLPHTHHYLVFIFFGFFATSSIVQIRYTDSPEAAWIYKVLPVNMPGHILSGAIKAMLVKFFLPMYLILMFTVLLIWGINLLPIMLLGAVLTITSTLISLLFQNPVLPFSQPREMQQKGMNSIKVFLGLLIMGVVVGIVYLASLVPVWLIVIFIVIALFLNTLLFNVIRKLTF